MQKQSERKTTAIQRRQRAVALRLAGRTYQTIAGELGVSLARAHCRVAEAVKSILSDTAESAQSLITLECQRLDAMHEALWPNAAAGGLQTVDRVLAIMSRRSRLLGLDAPARSEVSGPDGGPIRAQAAPQDEYNYDLLDMDERRQLLGLLEKCITTAA